MSLIRICESDDFMVDYDRDRGMYRVSIFENYHFKDEIWFDAYEEKEFAPLLKALPLKREERENASPRDSGFIDGWNAVIEEILYKSIN